MSILLGKNTRVIVQGVTGNEGLYHTREMVKEKTPIVAGVTPGRGGEWVLDGKMPVFDSVKAAVEVTDANTSVCFVPPRFAFDAMIESADAGIKLIVCITEGIPIRDTILVNQYLSARDVRLIGPNSPGIYSPGEGKVGIIPGGITIPGNVGVISRSGTLTYEVLFALKSLGIGISTCVGIGGDPIVGSSFVDILQMFETDAHTDKIVLIGEIGGNDEEDAADFIAQNMTKPVVAYIAGKSAPEGRKMGHAGAIIERNSGRAQDKINALISAGVKIAQHPEDVATIINNRPG